MEALHVIDPKPPAPPDAWWRLWRSFERALRADGTTEGTREVYAESSRQFHHLQEQRGRPLDPRQVTRDDLREFVLSLQERGLAPATVRSRLAALKRFFGWLQEEGELEADPSARVKAPRIPERFEEVLSEAEVERMYKACAGSSFEQRRDRALLRLLLETGMRRGDAAQLQLADVDLDSDPPRVLLRHRKGGRVSAPGLGPKLVNELDRYLRARDEVLDRQERSEQAFFIGQRGALSPDAISQLVTSLAKRAGIKRHVHAHMTRHTFADRWKAAGGSLEGLMETGGWKTVPMAMRYGGAARAQRAREEQARLFGLRR